MSGGDVDFDNPMFENDFKGYKEGTIDNTSSCVYSINPIYNEDSDKKTTISNNESIQEDSVDLEEEHHKGEAWDSNNEYVINTIGYVVGLGNFWGFPTYIVKYGASFFIPYSFCFFIFGVPMFFLDVYLGQFTNRGIIQCFGRCTLLRAIAVGTVAINLIVLFPYVMIMIWGLKYICISCKPELYFSKYKNNVTNFRSEIYFEKDGFGIEEASDGLANIGLPKWELIICSLVAWTLIFLCVFKGNKYSGKVIYATVIVPFAILIILLIFVATLPTGFNTFHKYFHLKDISNAEMWKDSAAQTLFSLSLTLGGIPTLASFRRFKSDLLLSSLVICCLDYLVSVVSSVVIIGFIAYIDSLPQFKLKNNYTGTELLFVVVPEAIMTNNRINPLWLILLYLLLLTLAFDTIITTVRTIILAIFELNGFPQKKNEKYYFLILSIIGFIVTIPMCCPGGLYWRNLINDSTTWCYIFLACLITTFIITCYGGLNVYYDIEFMLKETKFSQKIWKVFGKLCIFTWYISPIITFVLLILAFVTYNLFSIPNIVTEQKWVHFFEFLFSLSVPLVIIIYIIIQIFQAKGSIKEKFKYILSDDWSQPLWLPHGTTSDELNKLIEFKKDKYRGNFIKPLGKYTSE